MEKPFGTDLASARALNAEVHEVFAEQQVFRIDHFLGKEAAQNILALRFANGLFEPIWNRQHIDHVQIDVPETLAIGSRAGFYETTGAYRDMVVTHLFQVLAFVAMEPPTALEPRAITEEKNKVFRSLKPLDPRRSCAASTRATAPRTASPPTRDTETFVALRCEIDNWRWSGVPFYLRTGKRMAESARIISISYHEPPHGMFPAGSGSASSGPTTSPSTSTSPRGCRSPSTASGPGPGMRLDKLSMQFSLARDRPRRRRAGGLRAPDPRRDDRRPHALHDRRGDRAAVGDLRPRCSSTRRRSARTRPARGGPEAMQALIAPHTWRLPFARHWRAAPAQL